MKKSGQLFPALMKYWRHTRGLSQLDLAIEAGVSSRHISFLETGRANPSRAMVLRLGSVLSVPMRDQNIMLSAAGHEEAFEEGTASDGLPPGIQSAVDRMCTQQEPYPLLILNGRYDILRMNGPAEVLLPMFVKQPSAIQKPLNLLRLLFDEHLVRPYIHEWEQLAQIMISRIYKDALTRSGDHELLSFISELMSYPGVPQDWPQPNPSDACEATCNLHFQRDGLKLSFLATMTLFSAPQNLAVEEIIVESYFPADERTALACAELAGKHSPAPTSSGSRRSSSLLIETGIYE